MYSLEHAVARQYHIYALPQNIFTFIIVRHIKAYIIHDVIVVSSTMYMIKKLILKFQSHAQMWDLAERLGRPLFKRLPIPTHFFPPIKSINTIKSLPFLYVAHPSPNVCLILSMVK